MLKLLKEIVLSILINTVILRGLSHYRFGIEIDIQSISATLGFMLLGFVFWIFNFFIKKMVNILSFPLKIITLGLINIVINVGIIYGFARFINNHIDNITVHLGGFIQTLILSFVIFVAYFLLSKLLK